MNLRLGFTTLLCLMIYKLEHVQLPTQTIAVKGLQIETYLRLLSKINRLTKITLVIYFHETKDNEAIGLSNQKSQLKL